MRTPLMTVSDAPLRPSRRGSGTNVSWALFAVVWLALLAYGLRQGFLHATTAGLSELAPKVFPISSRLPRALDRATLFMFVHPECPCTRASLHELSGLLAEQS